MTALAEAVPTTAVEGESDASVARRERPRDRAAIMSNHAAASPNGDPGPHVRFEGFSGPLATLLAMARANNIDLARVPLLDMVDQLAAALLRPSALADKADWVVTASRIVALRSRLLLPSDNPKQRQAEAEAETLQARLRDLQVAQALSAWLDDRPQLGRDVFARGRPDLHFTPGDAEFEIDFIEFLWASVSVFDGFVVETDTIPVYRPRPPSLHTVLDATGRILRLLAEAPSGLPLAELLPRPGPEREAESWARERSAWTSTFVAGLELAKQGAVTLEQQAADVAPVLWLRHQPDAATAL